MRHNFPLPSRCRCWKHIFFGVVGSLFVFESLSTLQSTAFQLSSTPFTSRQATNLGVATRQPSGCRISRFAEGETGEASEIVTADQEVAETESHTVVPLFQELNVSNSTLPKKLMQAMVAVFNRGDRAVDLVLLDPRAKSTLMYSIAQLPDQFQAAAQMLVRRRDRRFRVRVIKAFRPAPDESPEVFRISKTTNMTKLTNAIVSKFVDVVGNNLKRTVKMQFAGRETAAQAILAIESAGQRANREFTFVPKFVYVGEKTQDADDHKDDASSGEQSPQSGDRQVSFDVTVVAT